FFFQAEDGIRDFHVTGVQTCALPILTDVALVMANAMSRLAEERPELRQELESMQQRSLATNHEPPVSKRLSAPHRRPPTNNGDRSEERRVGKECRSRVLPDR